MKGKVLALAILGLVALVATLATFYRLEQGEEQDRFAENQTLLTTLAARSAEGLLGQIETGLTHLAADGFARRDPAETLKQLTQFVPGQILEVVYLKDSQGNILAEHPSGRLASLPLPHHLLQNGLRPGQSPRVVSPEGRSLLLLAEPLHPEKRQGELAALVALDSLLEYAREMVGAPAGDTFLLDHAGRFLLHPEMGMSGRRLHELLSPGRQAELLRHFSAAFRGNSGYRRHRDTFSESDEEVLITSAPMKVSGSRWTLFRTLPTVPPAGWGGHHPAFLFLLGSAALLSPLSILVIIHLAGRNRTLEARLRSSDGEESRLRRLLTLAERRCRNLLENAGDAIFFIDPASGALLEANRRAEELLGYSAEEIRTLSLSALFPGPHRRRYLRLVKEVLRNGYGEEGNLRFRRKDGQLFIGAVHARLGDLGEAKVVHGALRDVTDIKRIEQELRQKNRDLTLVNEIAHRAAGTRDPRALLQDLLARVIQTVDADGGGVYLSAEEEGQLLLTAHQGIADEVLKDICRIVPGKGLGGRVAASGQPRSAADLQKDHRVRSQVVREAGWRSFQAVPLVANEKTIGVLFLFTFAKRIFTREEVNLLLAIGRQIGTAVEGARLFDALQWQIRVTEASNRELERSRLQLRQSLDRMEEANRALERLEKMKSNFLALASHELRTPLTYVISGTELLAATLRDRMSRDEESALDAVLLGAKRLGDIVHDLLEVAKLESRTIYLARESVHLPNLLDEVTREFRPLLEKRQLTCRVAEFPVSADLFGDTHHLKKTFRRLLENAVKFTPEGGRIEVSATLKTLGEVRLQEDLLRAFSPGFFQDAAADRLVQVTVRDSGVGIDSEDQVRVFDKFFEVGDISGHFTSRTRFGGKGVGLGLTLVKGMVEAHGGMVWVESPGAGAEQGGSAFHVLLPLDGTAETENGKSGEWRRAEAAGCGSSAHSALPEKRESKP